MAINATPPSIGTGTGTGTGIGTGTGTGATGAAGGATGSSATALTGGVNLGGANFLTLMLAQLKNQDPTSPIDSNQFLNQLAQLSQVQGIAQLNTSFSSLANSLTSSQALQASSLLGHQVLVSSSTATLAANGTVSGAVNVPQDSAQVVVNVADSSGALLRQINLGAQPAGLANFTWDGTLADGSPAAAGAYTVTAQVAGVGSGTAVATYINGLVQSVSMGGGGSGGGGTTAGSGALTLNVSGQGSVPFSSVLQISN